MATDLGAVIGTIYDGIVATLNSKSGVLIGDGQDLATVLLLITLSWSVLLWLLSGDGPQALMDSFGTMTRWAIVTIMLTGWLGIVGGMLQANTNDISQKLAGTSSISESVGLMANAASRLLTDGSKIKELCKEETVGDPSGTGVTYSEIRCEKTSSRGATASWIDMLVMLPVVLLTMLLKFLALGFMVLMLAAYITVIFMAEVLFGIGMALGPILVPWLIWQRTEWLFDGWLKFTLAACFTKIVAALMTAVVSSVIFGAKVLSENIKVESGMELIAVDEMAAFLMCVVAAVGTFLMWQVPGIAQGLLSGSLGIRAQNFGRGSIGSAISGAATNAGKAPGLKNDMKELRSKLAELGAKGNGK